MRTDNIFRICSVSKSITSVAVMMLYEQGCFTLNESVGDVIPEFKNMKALDPPFPQDKTSPIIGTARLARAGIDSERPHTAEAYFVHTKFDRFANIFSAESDLCREIRRLYRLLQILE